MHDVIVIGGGISGMSFAHFCADAGLAPLVVEREQQAGGCLRSWRQPGGYWSELGAHTCYSSYATLLSLLERRSAMTKLLPRAKVPFRLLLGDELRPIDKELKVFELLRSLPRVLTTKKQGVTVREYYSRIAGRGNYERVLGPMFAAVPSQPADDFPADIFLKRRKRRKDVPRSYTAEGGLSTFIDALAATPKVTVRTGVAAAQVERASAGFVVQLADGTSERARRLALALPPSDAVSVLSSTFAALAQALARIRMTTIDSVGLVFPRDGSPVPPVAGIIPLDGRFYSAVSRDTVPDPERRAFTFHGRPGVSLDERAARACAVLRLDRRHLEHLTRREVVLPSPRLGHAEITAAIDKAIAGTDLFVTGNYFGGLSIEDCVLRSRAEAERLRAAIQGSRSEEGLR